MMKNCPFPFKTYSHNFCVFFFKLTHHMKLYITNSFKVSTNMQSPWLAQVVGHTTFQLVALALPLLEYLHEAARVHTLALQSANACSLKGQQIIVASCSRFADPLPDLPSFRHQPSDFTFPKCSFGKTSVMWRSFQPSWFKQWPFLHYNEANDQVFSTNKYTLVLGLEWPEK